MCTDTYWCPEIVFINRQKIRYLFLPLNIANVFCSPKPSGYFRVVDHLLPRTQLHHSIQAVSLPTNALSMKRFHSLREWLQGVLMEDVCQSLINRSFVAFVGHAEHISMSAGRFGVISFGLKGAGGCDQAASAKVTSLSPCPVFVTWPANG